MLSTGVFFEVSPPFRPPVQSADDTSMFERLAFHRISVIQYCARCSQVSRKHRGICTAYLVQGPEALEKSLNTPFLHSFLPAGRSKKAFRNSTHPQLPESKSFSRSCPANQLKKKRFHRCSRQSMVSSVSFSSAGVTQWKNSLAGPHNSSQHFWTMSDCVSSHDLFASQRDRRSTRTMSVTLVAIGAQ